MPHPDLLRQRAAALQLHGLLAHWNDCAGQPWLPSLLDWEEAERARRSLERRLFSFAPTDRTFRAAARSLHQPHQNALGTPAGSY